MPSSSKSADVLEEHLSNLHARLVATLDALDEIGQNHEAELEQLHDQARYLHARCQVFKSRAKEAEAERDELKADVNKLVEKVEIANDHRVLPHSRIHLPRPLEPLLTQSPINTEEDVHRDAYFPAILNCLSAELTAQKSAFSELQRISDARIAALEAQVARREVELYSHKSCSCRSSATLERSASNPHKRPLQPTGTTLSKAQYTLIEEETATRQRTLEVEIDGLKRKLQSAQSDVLRSKLPPAAPEILRNNDPKLRDPASSHSPIHNIGPEPTTHPVLSDIDQQIARFGKEVDTLQTERDNIKGEVRRGSENDAGYPNGLKDQDFKGVLLIEEECIRLRNSERSLRQELLLAKAAASATEHSLKSLVNRLQRQIHILCNPDVADMPAHDQFDNYDPNGEVLNDVASEHTVTRNVEAPFSSPPLRSSTPPAQSALEALLSGITNDDRDAHHSSSSSSPYDRPPSAPPFVFGHQHHRRQHPTTRVQHHHADPRVARIESELNQARSDVRGKDLAIGALRAQLAALQEAVQAGTLDGMRFALT